MEHGGPFPQSVFKSDVPWNWREWQRTALKQDFDNLNDRSEEIKWK